jgi:hypothetical protein
MLDDPLDEVQRALMDLRRARDETTAWSDDGRRVFDEQRLDPLVDAGAQILAAIRNAQDQFSDASRQIARQSD